MIVIVNFPDFRRFEAESTKGIRLLDYGPLAEKKPKLMGVFAKIPSQPQPKNRFSFFRPGLHYEKLLSGKAAVRFLPDLMDLPAIEDAKTLRRWLSQKRFLIGNCVPKPLQTF